MNSAIFGDFRITILFCLIIAFTVLSSWLFRALFQRYIKRNIKRFNEDPTNYQFIQHFMTGIIYM